MMRAFFGLVLCFAVALVNAEDTLDETNVRVLKEDNFANTIEDNPLVLVEFYAPWCGHCKALAPEYAKAADTLAEQGSNIILAKVDATEENTLAQSYEVRGYPTLKFFKNGEPKDYNGGRKADDIVQWVLRNSGPATTTLETTEAAKALIEKNEVAIIGYFEKVEDSVEAGAYAAAADSLSDSLTFGIVTSKDVADEMDAEFNSIIVYKKFDEEKAVFSGNWTAESIIKFIQGEELPLVVTFSDEVAPKIFSGNIRTHLLVFFPKKSENFDSYLENLRAVAKDFKGVILFVHIDTDAEESDRIMEFFSITKDNIPASRLIDMGAEMRKYVPEFSGFDQDEVRNFCKDFVDGKLSPHLNSEDVPEDWNKESVAVLVGKNFNEVALDQSKHVFVEFYAPWCGHCKQLAPIWDQLGDHFKEDDDVVIAKMDATKNEVQEVQIQGFPTLKFFPKGSDKVFSYDGGRTLNELIEYVEKHVNGEEVEDTSADMDDIIPDDPETPGKPLEDDEEPEEPPRDEL